MNSIELCVLASGSDGNATYIRSGETSVLVDAGLSAAGVCRRLESAGVQPESIDAVLVTHEHIDHIRGVLPFCRKFGCRFYANRPTLENSTLSGAPASAGPVVFHSDSPFTVGEFRVTPFPVPHDAARPVGFVLEDGRTRVGVATDLGSATLEVLAALKGCDIVVLESNHDETMLEEGPYPPFLKNRVRGPLGHLSNDDAGELVRNVFHREMVYLVMVHLSRINNLPELTFNTALESLGHRGSGVKVSLGWHDRTGSRLRV